MLTCQQMTEVITDYLEGRMGVLQRLKFQMHVGMCKDCRAYLGQMKKTVATLGKMPDEPVPEDVLATLRESFKDWNKGEGE